MEKKINIENMSAQHQFTWNVLTMLEEGERILGTDLQKRVGVKDIRSVFQIIKHLRHNGYLVGADKNETKGYYQIRSEKDLENTLHALRSPAFDLLNTAKLMEKHFIINELGMTNEESLEKGVSDDE